MTILRAHTRVVNDGRLRDVGGPFGEELQPPPVSDVLALHVQRRCTTQSSYMSDSEER
jgi:hypothetical protein